MFIVRSQFFHNEPADFFTVNPGTDWENQHSPVIYSVFSMTYTILDGVNFKREGGYGAPVVDWNTFGTVVPTWNFTVETVLCPPPGTCFFAESSVFSVTVTIPATAEFTPPLRPRVRPVFIVAVGSLLFFVPLLS
jgi:hypothetical protein